MQERRRIGSLEVSVAGLGCNNFGRRIDRERTREVVAAALDAGVTLFDTADVYGDGASEEYLGAALGRRRDDVVIVTKFGYEPPSGGSSGGDPEWVREACAASLKRLGTGHIDLYLLHKPDPRVPIGETMAAMHGLVEQGAVREIGCSNFSRRRLEEAAAVATEQGLRAFVCVENEYNLLHREPEEGLLDAAERLDMAFLPYFPLASGLLSGKYRRGRPAPETRLGGGGELPAEQVVGEERIAAVERLCAFAESRGHTLLELGLSWLATRPRVASVIAGATRPEQVRANAEAVTAWRLTDEELAELDELTGRS
jgi:aryl-alcohol dehydrogenase-like predicted oxidoreductase